MKTFTVDEEKKIFQELMNCERQIFQRLFQCKRNIQILHREINSALSKNTHIRLLTRRNTKNIDASVIVSDATNALKIFSPSELADWAIQFQLNRKIMYAMLKTVEADATVRGPAQKDRDQPLRLVSWQDFLLDQYSLSTEEFTKLSEDVNSLLQERINIRNTIVIANMKLAKSISLKYAHNHASLSEIEQHGNLGLIKAVFRFEPLSGFKFSTYATWWVRQEITKYILTRRDLITVVTNGSKQSKKIKEFSKQFRAENAGEDPTAFQIAENVKISIQDADKNMARNMQTSVIPDDYLKSEVCSATRDDTSAIMDKILSRLSVKDEQIIRLFFGLRTEALDNIAQSPINSRSSPIEISKVSRKLRLSDRIKHYLGF